MANRQCVTKAYEENNLIKFTRKQQSSFTGHSTRRKVPENIATMEKNKMRRETGAGQERQKKMDII